MNQAMTSAQTTLVATIRKMFVNRPFDTTSIACEARHCPELATALEAVVPRWYRSRAALRRALTKLANQHFDTDEYGWWHCRLTTFPSPGEDAA